MKQFFLKEDQIKEDYQEAFIIALRGYVSTCLRNEADSSTLLASQNQAIALKRLKGVPLAKFKDLFVQLEDNNIDITVWHVRKQIKTNVRFVSCGIIEVSIPNGVPA